MLFSYLASFRVGGSGDAVHRIEKGSDVVASRTQIPLKLAWAITIHKSQGMSISRLEVSLGDIFDAGMGYVALSRGVSLAGIK